MGYYIHTNVNHKKAEVIIKTMHGKLAALPSLAQVTSNEYKPADGFIPFVVVTNPAFEAAAIAFDSFELQAFLRPDDQRPKVFLEVPKAEVIKVQPVVEQHLDW